ncbi:MAG: class I SAM-dependent methyltransferase [Gemmatimonadetes bacterium]|nr:class I SAM-dependent methyltransferase [Gemmatimonadota bacterium]
MSERCSAVLEQVSNTIEGVLRAIPSDPDGHLGGHRPPRILDVGCWDGEEAVRYVSAIGGEGAGVEVFPGPAEIGRQRGLQVEQLDLERERLPWEDGKFDVVIANQVLEHLKNVWLPLSAIWRVLAPGGRLIVSAPNLASLHNRVLLCLGRQPTSVRTLGPHVRGFTMREIRSLVSLGGAFKVERTLGVVSIPFRSAGLVRSACSGRLPPTRQCSSLDAPREIPHGEETAPHGSATSRVNEPESHRPTGANPVQRCLTDARRPALRASTTLRSFCTTGLSPAVPPRSGWSAPSRAHALPSLGPAHSAHRAPVGQG